MILHTSLVSGGRNTEALKYTTGLQDEDLVYASFTSEVHIPSDITTTALLMYWQYESVCIYWPKHVLCTLHKIQTCLVLIYGDVVHWLFNKAAWIHQTLQSCMWPLLNFWQACKMRSGNDTSYHAIMHRQFNCILVCIPSTCSVGVLSGILCGLWSPGGGSCSGHQGIHYCAGTMISAHISYTSTLFQLQIIY